MENGPARSFRGRAPGLSGVMRQPGLPVACVSLGGTKLQVGAHTRDGRYLVAREFHWRRHPAFVALPPADDATRFCEVLLDQVAGFLAGQGYRLEDVALLGLAFPGPRRGGLWYSNNLLPVFSRGVAYEQLMQAALARRPGGTGVRVRVLGDAQCDAGGELYHPRGCLCDDRHGSAVVLNLATGIAAGLVHQGRVLLARADFQAWLGPGYDENAGQLGRHLWYYPDQGCWRYHYCAGGDLPPVRPGATRMTERLSGPALAARLLLRLGRAGLLPDEPLGAGANLSPAEVESLYRDLEGLRPDHDLTAATQAMRRAARPVASGLLAWADEIYGIGHPQASADCIAAFAGDIADELVAALRVWGRVPGWRPYLRRVVLTGGVGIRFLASSDGIVERSFIHRLNFALPPDCRVDRSRLDCAVERECGLFLHQRA